MREKSKRKKKKKMERGLSFPAAVPTEGHGSALPLPLMVVCGAADELGSAGLKYEPFLDLMQMQHATIHDALSNAFANADDDEKVTCLSYTRQLYY